MNHSYLIKLLSFVRSHHFVARIENDAVLVEIPYTHATLSEGVDVYSVRTLAEARDVLGY